MAGAFYITSFIILLALTFYGIIAQDRKERQE